jgi:N,N-dimethylformamidase beta subunit-like protein
MATNPQLSSRGAVRRATIAAFSAALAAIAIAGNGTPTTLEGKLPRQKPTTRPTVRASFPRESYAPGETARLVIASAASSVDVRIYHAGLERTEIVANDEMRGAPVTPRASVGDVRVGRVREIRIGDWPSGLYYARLDAAGGRIGYAPFLVRPRRLGEHRIAVVLPTQTWQAYNFTDDDGDGDEDTWYAGGDRAHTGRPFENRGVPTNYKRYEQPFLRWLVRTGREVDHLAQAALNHVSSGRALAEAYDLIVFPGHHEYVTRREYDAVESFRDLGGNLAFLSANNFFWRVVRRGNLMIRSKQWRQLGRPESALVGVQYFANDRGQHRAPWIVTNPWAGAGLLASSGLQAGSRLGNGGIEVDATTSSSPPTVKVLAELPWRHGKKGQMTFYETPAGAKVFAAGAFTLAGSIGKPDVGRLLENLWTRLARP